MAQIPPPAERLLERLEQAGYEAYIVGGCVRDLLRGRTPQDWDVTTSALPEQVMALFDGAVPTGLQHGTVTVPWEGRRCEVTTFRSDGIYSDHRHPDTVTFTAELRQDLARRDFTVNAMAMDRRGRLTDLWDGQADLRRGVLRCVGEADRRFEEDALRIMRGLRFAAVLGFTVEPDTARSMAARCGELRQIAAERLREEMTKLLCGGHACEVLLAYPHVIGAFLPEILPCVGLEQRNPHHCYDVWEHIARSVAAIAPEPVLRWTMLLHDLGKGLTRTIDDAGIGHFYGHGAASSAIAAEVVRRLRFDGDSAGRIVSLVDWHDRDVPRTEKGLRRALYHLGEAGTRQLIAVKRADNAAQHPDYRARQAELDRAEEILNAVLAAGDCFSLRQLAVRGGDLLALGFRGPAIGQALERLLSDVVDGVLPNERQALLSAAAKWK